MSQSAYLALQISALTLNIAQKAPPLPDLLIAQTTGMLCGATIIFSHSYDGQSGCHLAS